MYSFDNIENTNAKEWNSVGEELHPDATDIGRKQRKWRGSRADEQATIRQQVDCNNENPTISPDGNIANSHEEAKGHKARFTPLKVRRPNRLEPNGKRPVRNLNEWSKTTAVNTRRMQAHLAQETDKANLDKRFLSQPLRDKLHAVGFYQWSDSNSAPNELLGEGLQLLDDVRTEFQVFIDYVERLGCIRLRSYHFTNIEKGIAGVRAKIRDAEADVAALAPLYMVEPPSTLAMRSELTPRFKANENIKHQLVVEKVVLSGSRLSAEEAVKFEGESKTMLTANQELLSNHLKQAFTHFQSSKSCMHMRVSFGQFNLLMYRKDFRESTYSFQDFSHMMGESRTKAYFNQSIRAQGFDAELLDSIKRSSSIFEPADSITPCLAAVEPKHSLIVLARGSSSAKVRVEADMDIVDGADETQGRVWQVGAATYYQQNDRKTRLVAGTISLESFDWRLEIFSDRTLLSPPAAFKEILAAVASAESVYAIKGSKFSFPLITPRSPLGVTIEEYWMRSVLRYQLTGTSYIIEVAIYRGWRNGEMNREISREFQISFYHADWDILTGLNDGVTGQKGWVWNSFFPTDPASADGLEHFLNAIRAVQTFLTHLHGVTQKVYKP